MSHRAKNQGWKDSGDAIIYDDGSPVQPPIATCELQGYWYIAQELMSVLSWIMDAKDDSSAHRKNAAALKQRFNRDWWFIGRDSAPRLRRSCVASHYKMKPTSQNEAPAS